MDHNNISVLIVEPSWPTAKALSDWVTRRPGFSSCGAVGSLLMVPHALSERHPDVVLVDVPHRSAPTLGMVRELAAEESSPKFVVLGSHPSPTDICDAVDAGASGYASTDDDPTELARVITSAAEGHVTISREAAVLLGVRV